MPGAWSFFALHCLLPLSLQLLVSPHLWTHHLLRVHSSRTQKRVVQGISQAEAYIDQGWRAGAAGKVDPIRLDKPHEKIDIDHNFTWVPTPFRWYSFQRTLVKKDSVAKSEVSRAGDTCLLCFLRWIFGKRPVTIAGAHRWLSGLLSSGWGISHSHPLLCVCVLRPSVVSDSLWPEMINYWEHPWTNSTAAT